VPGQTGLAYHSARTADKLTAPRGLLARRAAEPRALVEREGGHEGAGWLVDNRPETLRCAGAVNEAGGVSAEIGGRRFYPIQGAEKGQEVYRNHVRGTGGHASMPREGHAGVKAGDRVGAMSSSTCQRK